MHIGFPVVVQSDVINEVVNIWLSVTPSSSGSIELKNAPDVGEGQKNHLNLADLPAFYHSQLHRFRALNCMLTFELDGSHAARCALFLDGKLSLQGASGSVALFLLESFHQRFGQHKEGLRILASGVARYSANDSLEILPLGLAFRNDTNIKIAHAASKGIDLWMHTDDLAEYAGNAESLIPYEADSGDKDWLLHEFADRYGLTLTTFPSYSTHSEIEGEYYERQLFERAIAPSALTNRNKILDDFFALRASRCLLPIQALALKKGNSEAIFAPLGGGTGRSSLRHCLLTGPTGCGKTTLLHAIVLNGLHNRGGGVLYLGPTRALVEEFFNTITDELESLLPMMKNAVVLSTGDYNRDDSAITSGKFGLACMVNEKANVLFSVDDLDALMNRLSIVIIDELHMLSEPARGGLLDLLVSSFALHARKQWQKYEKPIQIFGITTESLAEYLTDIETFRLDPDDDETGPQSLRVSERPIPVEHAIAVIYETEPTREPKWSLKPFLTFRSLNDRSLSSEDIHKLLENFNVTGEEARQYRERESSYDRVRLDSQLQELILAKRLQHKTLIVAVDSVDKTESYANALVKRLNGLTDEVMVSKDFEDALQASGISRERMTRMLNWASRGIYVHNAQLPRKLRGAIEKVFRATVKPNDRRKLLLTTETLTYGVNLSASGVILTTTKMTRDDLSDPFAEPTSQPMDANQFHNLLGRAGRMGFWHTPHCKAEAIVCVGLSDFSQNASRVSFLERYYGRPVPKGMVSRIVLPGDLARLRLNKTTKEWYERDVLGASEYSFPTLRTVLDATRKSGIANNADTIVSFVKETIGYQTAASQGEKKKTELLCRMMLEKTAEFTEGDIKLVDISGKGPDQRYTLQAAGAALIDTGTSLQSVTPVASWMQHLHKFGIAGKHVETLIVGFLCAPDFTKIAGELVPEARYEESVTDQIIQEWTATAVYDLRSEWELIGSEYWEYLLTTLMDYMSSATFATVFRKQPNADIKKIAIIKLLTITLKWLRGCPVEELLNVARRNLEQRQKKEWGSKYAERLENLCRMCYRFFADATGYLSEEQQRQLPRLALRLKHGLPYDGLPYLNVMSLEGILPREAVVRLYEAVPDPFVLLSCDRNIMSRIDKVLTDFAHANVRNAEGVVNIVRSAYADSVSAFFSQVKQGNAETFVSDAESAIRRKGTLFDSSWQPRELLNCRLLDSPQRNLRIVPIENSVSYEEIVGVSCLKFGMRGGKDEICLIGWHTRPQNGYWTITPCGYVLLVSLLMRGLIGLRIVNEVMLTRSPARINVAWISAHLLGGEDMYNLRNFREFLLTFVEPVSSLN